MIARRRVMAGLLVAAASLWLSPSVYGQKGTYHPPRTPWGDPDLQGNYTNKYEQSTPLERPGEFAGRRREDVTGAELTALLAARDTRVLARPEAVGPLQFRDPLEVTKGSLPWLIVDPPGGKMTRNDGEAVLEFACHEGNYAIPGILNAERRSEKR